MKSPGDSVLTGGTTACLTPSLAPAGIAAADMWACWVSAGTPSPLTLSSMHFFLKLSDIHVFSLCVGEVWQEGIGAGMFFGTGCTVSLRSLVRFKNCRLSSFWKGAEGTAWLAALIDVLPSEHQCSISVA